MKDVRLGAAFAQKAGQILASFQMAIHMLSLNSINDQALSLANFFGFRTVSDMFAYFKQTGKYNTNVFLAL